MRAFYNSTGFALLIVGIDSPESYDVTAPDPGPERHDSLGDSDDSPQPTYRETYGVDPIPASVSIADLFAQMKAEITKERGGVRKVVETTGETVSEVA